MKVPNFLRFEKTFEILFSWSCVRLFRKSPVKNDDVQQKHVKAEFRKEYMLIHPQNHPIPKQDGTV